MIMIPMQKIELAIKCEASTNCIIISLSYGTGLEIFLYSELEHVVSFGRKVMATLND